ncbi:MAG: alpha/beta hydrolase [Solirubrobacteraceae bacterium]|jgi:polyhydroxyalkanoate synthase|nr:alpha/beta hydrolase [Solirubrobacteraceae bacterium]MCU0312784.1 alpha/beta hydrolase [Solirubrobacteraceae bacterium]
MELPPNPDSLGRAAANAYDKVFRGGVADLRRTPARIIDEAPKRVIYRYLAAREEDQHELPVLFVPPLAAPTISFDLRRGCSMAEHFIAMGHPTYLVEYGSIAFSDRDLGLEFWVRDVLPNAVRRVSEDSGGKPVQLLGWCLGGIMALLSVAGDPKLPVASVSTVASPFDFAQVRLAAPIRAASNVTNGFLGSAIYKTFGGAPAPLVKWAFQLTSIDKYLTKPLAIATHLDDRDFLAQIEAVDHFMAHMHAYPGRTMGQLYHRFFRVNDLADGDLDLGDGQGMIDLADVDVPVLVVAGETDVLAPRPAVHHVAELLTGAPEVRLETAPGGHLGVLTGRGAAKTTWAWIDDFLAETSRSYRRPALRVVA